MAQIELYKSEVKNRQDGEQSKVALGIERDKKMNGTNFNTKYNVFIPFYLNSYRDHSDGNSFVPLINGQVMSGAEVSEFPIDSIDEIPFRPFVNFKLSPKKIYQIYSILEEYDSKIKILEESIHNGKTYESTDYNILDAALDSDTNIDKYETLYECIMYDSTCCKRTGKMKPVGILWHDTGVNNTSIKRYVQPSKRDPNYNKLLNLIGKNQYANDWNTVEHNAGVNAWIGKLADGTIATVQALPWDYRPWGCDSGNYGSHNNGWIQFEICEDAKNNSTYFNSVYKEALKLTSYLCKKFNNDPKGTVNYNGISVPTIVCHWDSYRLGVGSGHYDIYDWFPKFGKCKNLTMEDVRNDVASILDSIDS